MAECGGGGRFRVCASGGRMLALLSLYDSSEAIMAVLTIRRLDDGVHARLRMRAARSGVSVEEEVRRILAAAAAADDVPETGFGTWLNRRFLAATGGAGLETDPPSRAVPRDPPDFAR